MKKETLSSLYGCMINPSDIRPDDVIQIIPQPKGTGRMMWLMKHKKKKTRLR